MASRKKQKTSQGNNLRILSIAYANSRLERETYLKLRTQQLSALNFGKPIPPLPEELSDIKIPSIKIDSPHQNSGSPKKNFRLWGAIAAVLLITIIGGSYFWLNGGQINSKPQINQTSLQDKAQKLIVKPSWSEPEIATFKKLWATRSAQAKAKAKQSQWYLSLENEIIKRINQKKLQRDNSPDVREHQKELNHLRLFYAALKAE